MAGERVSARGAAKRAAEAEAAAGAVGGEPETPPRPKKARGAEAELAAAEWVAGQHSSRETAAAAHGFRAKSASTLSHAKKKLEETAKERRMPLRELAAKVIDANRAAHGGQATTQANLADAVTSPGLDKLHLSQAEDLEEKRQRGIEWAVKSGRPTRQCEDMLKDKGVEKGTSAATIARARNRGAPSTPPSQNAAVLPKDFEDSIANTIRLWRSNKWQVTADDIIGWVAGQIEGTEYEARFKDGTPTTGWVSRFLKRKGFDTGKDPGLEKSRAQWCTVENLTTHYNVTRDALLMSNIFELNPDFDPEKDYSLEIVVKKGNERFLDAVFGMDETKVVHSMKARGGEKQARTVRVEGDNGETTSDLAGFSYSLLAGSTASGKTLVPRVSMPSPLPVWEKKDEPTSGFPSVAPRVSSNDKGSIDSAMMVTYLKGEIKSAILDPLGITKDSEIKAVMLFDGCSSHLTPEMVDACQELGIIAQPGLPNGSHMTNREDLVGFAIFKPRFRKAQRELLKQKQTAAAAAGKTVRGVGLAKEDFCRLLKEPFENAFSVERNKMSWGGSLDRGTGIYPFNRCQLVKLKRQVAAVAAQQPAGGGAAQQSAGEARQQPAAADSAQLYATVHSPLHAAIVNGLAVQRQRQNENARAGGGATGSGEDKPLRLKAAHIWDKVGGLSNAEVIEAAARVRTEKQQKEAATRQRTEKRLADAAGKRSKQAAAYRETQAQLSQPGATLRTLKLRVDKLKLLLGHLGQDIDGKKEQLYARLVAAWDGAGGGAGGGGADAGYGGARGGGDDLEDKEEDDEESD